MKSVVVIPIEQWLWYMNLVGDVAVLLTLLGRRLTGFYGLLCAYMLVDLVQGVLLYALPSFGFSSGARLALAYSQVFGAGQALKWILSLWFVLELYGRALAPQPALAKFGRGFVGILFLVSAAISLVGIFVRPSRLAPAAWDFETFSRLESSLDSTSAILLLLMAAFLLWFPVKVRRNAASYMTGFIVYFLAHWAALRATELWHPYERWLSAANLGVAFACMLFWIVTMRPEGESAVTVTGHRWNPLKAEHLVQQLDALNGRLDHLFRR